MHRQRGINEAIHNDRGFPSDVVRHVPGDVHLLRFAGVALILVDVDVGVTPAGESVPYHHEVLHGDQWWHFTRSVSRNRKKSHGCNVNGGRGRSRAGVREGIHLALQMGFENVTGYRRRRLCTENCRETELVIAFAVHEKDLEYHGIGPLPYI